MKFKDIINAVDTTESVKMTNWVFLFSAVYLCTSILALIIFYLTFKDNAHGPSMFIATVLALSSIKIVTEKFVKKHNRVFNFPEYKKFLYESFCAVFIIQTLFAVLALLGTLLNDPIKPNYTPTREFLFIMAGSFALTMVILFLTQILALKSVIKYAAKKLQKAAAKQLSNTPNASEPI